jgi:hypothetical protein
MNRRSRTLVGAFVLAASSARADAPQASSVEDRLKKLQAQVDELSAAADASDQAALKEPTFRLYGFIDMGLQKLWTNDVTAGSTGATFVLGNINLYLDFHPAEDWRSLVEVRFTNYPGDATSETFDPANGTGDDLVRWSAIVIERAYLQWQKHDWFGVRVGEFLTPYGIWNVDHGTPTLIALLRPEFVTKEMWPSHLLGVEAFGKFPDLLPGDWQLEYHAYVSNGRTAGVIDPTNDKTVGGHVIISTTQPHRMAFGVSFMDGTFDDTTAGFDLGTGMTNPPQHVAYREDGIALDASIDVGALRLRSEIITRRLDYKEGEHALTAVPGVYAADSLEGDAYALAAYRISGTRYEPFVYAEGYRVPTAEGDLQATASAGLNIYFTPAIQLKLQYSHSRWYDLDGLSLTRQTASEDFLAAKLVMGI